MALNTIKCPSCNVVINEILSFIINKIDVMDCESLVKICASTYEAKEVDNAKHLLFDSIKTKKRCISRKKVDGKIQRDLLDIINLLQNTDPEEIPIFVAKDLQKLPPVTFDHIDVTALLKELVLLRSEINCIKETLSIKEDLENKIHAQNIDSPLFSDVKRNYVNTRKRGAKIVSNESITFMTPDAINCTLNKQPKEDTRSSTFCHQNMSISSTKNQVVDLCIYNSQINNGLIDEQLNGNTQLTQAAIDTQSKDVNGSLVNSKNLQLPRKKLSFAELAGDGKPWCEPEKDEGWIKVQNKRPRYRYISHKGKASSQPDNKFKAADEKVALFISNVDKSVSESDIAEYILTKTSQRVLPIKIKMKYEKNYNAYKIFVDRKCIDTFLDDKLWPDRVSFRRFYNYRYSFNSQKIIDSEF